MPAVPVCMSSDEEGGEEASSGSFFFVSSSAARGGSAVTLGFGRSRCTGSCGGGLGASGKATDCFFSSRKATKSIGIRELPGHTEGFFARFETTGIARRWTSDELNKQ